MALQHFYSRVPARVSMYNRADSFDTFAHSEGLDREFIERELALVYENKLGKNDISMARRGELPCVYSQCCTRSGVLVQNCISYLPLDYTGERSAYLSHSLVYSEEEKNVVLGQKDRAVFNPELFTTDITPFDITAATAAPDGEYPTAEYTPGAAVEEFGLLKSFEPETVKAFLYAVLNCLCGKGKSIYFRVSDDGAQLSQLSLQLINEVMAILPVSLRQSLSFVSFVNDTTQYPSFKLKGVSGTFPDMPSGKGVFFDLQTNLVVGLQQTDVVANKPLLNFFYSLVENKGLCAEFLVFMERAVSVISNLRSLNLKVLNDLVFLFRQSCGLFSEKEILPNDTAVYDFLCVYEKYRAALGDEYRMQAYKCLLRYSNCREAVPKNIFAKMSKLYPAEIAPAKRIVMNIVLELIHTDVMRDKLFTFIRNNYDVEEQPVKQVIMADLSRVFYGGFLHNQLLGFFSDRFEYETPETKTLILEKLFLSIRTPAVQSKILEFIDLHYPRFEPEHKDAFYQTFFEMLRECDGLSAALVSLVNRYMEQEDEERKAQVTERLVQVLEADYRRKEHKLAAILSGEGGFCNDVVLKLAFGSWQSRKLHTDYLSLLGEKPAVDKTAILVRAFELVGAMESDVAQRLQGELENLYRADGERTNLYQWFDAVNLSAGLPGELAGKLKELVLNPGICRTVFDVFKVKYGTEGMETLCRYAQDNPDVWNCERYPVITAYKAMIAAVGRGEYAAAMARLEVLLQYPEILPNVAEYVGACAIDRKTQPTEQVLCLEILQGCLKNKKAKLDELYAKRNDALLQDHYANHGDKVNADKVSQEAARGAMGQMLTVCLGMCTGSNAVDELLCGDNSGAREMMSSFMNGHGKGAVKWLQAQLAAQAKPCGFASLVENTRQKGKTSFFGKLFGR